MSTPAALVQKLWNYCNIGSLAPVRSGLRPSAPQNPFRSFPSGSSLRDDGLSYGGICRSIFAALLLVVASGCGLTVHQKMAVQQFGSATTEFASVTRAEFIHSRQDVIEMNRMRILLGATNVAALDDPFTLETTQARLRAFDALNEYGGLLQTLLTTSSSAELQSSADGFVSSLNNVPGAQMNASQAEAVGKAVAMAGGFLVEHKRAKAMKRVVELAHPHVTNVIALVERDFDPNDDFWSAGYRRAQMDLEKMVRRTPVPATNDLAGAQVLRASRLMAQESERRFALVSTNVIQVVKRLREAEGRLHGAMTSPEVGLEDIQEYRARVNEMKTLFELLRSKTN